VCHMSLRSRHLRPFSRSQGALQSVAITGRRWRRVGRTRVLKPACLAPAPPAPPGRTGRGRAAMFGSSRAGLRPGRHPIGGPGDLVPPTRAGLGALLRRSCVCLGRGAWTNSAARCR
jgi:hypothetical protein